MRSSCQGFMGGDCAEIGFERLFSAGLIAFLAGMGLELLIERHICVAGLWIAMRQMPCSTEFATVHPQLSAAFTPALVGGLLSRCLVVIHDLIRLSATFGYEIVHKHSVYLCVRMCRPTGRGVPPSVGSGWGRAGHRKGRRAKGHANTHKTPSPGARRRPRGRRARGRRQRKGTPSPGARQARPGKGSQRLDAAARYSPTPSRVQYHHRARP